MQVFAGLQNLEMEFEVGPEFPFPAVSVAECVMIGAVGMAMNYYGVDRI